MPSRNRRAPPLTRRPAPGVMRRHPYGHCWLDAEGLRVHPLTRLRGADGVYSASEWLETRHDVLEVVWGLS